MLSRRTGLVLTIGSFSALVPSAMLATYSGSKAFLERWSQALGEETKEFGVDIQLVVPYFVVRFFLHLSLCSLLSLFFSVFFSLYSLCVWCVSKLSDTDALYLLVVGLIYVEDPSTVSPHPDRTCLCPIDPFLARSITRCRTESLHVHSLLDSCYL